MGVEIKMEDFKEELLQEYHSSVGFDRVEKKDDLDLLASKEERKFFLYLIKILPNVTNVDIIPVTTMAMLLGSIKRLGEYMELCESNVELYIKLLSKRNESISKLDAIMKSYGLTNTTKEKAFICFDEVEGDE